MPHNSTRRDSPCILIVPRRIDWPSWRNSAERPPRDKNMLYWFKYNRIFLEHLTSACGGSLDCNKSWIQHNQCHKTEARWLLDFANGSNQDWVATNQSCFLIPQPYTRVFPPLSCQRLTISWVLSFVVFFSIGRHLYLTIYVFFLKIYWLGISLWGCCDGGDTMVGHWFKSP